MVDSHVTRVNGPETVSVGGGDFVDVTEDILPRVSKRRRWGDAGSHVELVAVLDNPDFSVVISSNPLDVSIHKDPALTNDDLVSDTLSPIEIITTIYEEHMVFGGLDHLVTGIENIGWVNRSGFRTNLDSSHPKSVVTINSPSHRTLVE